MHDDDAIKKKAYQKLESMSPEELADVQEIDFEVYFSTEDDHERRYTVFMERGFVDGKEGWVVRHIVRPDKLEKPEKKDRGKIE